MATIEDKFNMLDKELQLRMAHILEFANRLKQNDAVVLIAPGWNGSEQNIEYAIEYQRDEELIQYDLQALVYLGFADEIYDEEMGARIIQPKPAALKVARKFMVDNGMPSLPDRTYHLYQFDIDNEIDGKSPTVIMVRDNPHDILKIAPISSYNGDRMGINPDVVIEMQKGHKALYQSIRDVKSKPLKFHLSPQEWSQANQMTPPLVSLLESANCGYETKARIKNYEGDITPVHVKNIIHAYNVDVLDSISKMQEVLDRVAYENDRQSRNFVR